MTSPPDSTDSPYSLSRDAFGQLIFSDAEHGESASVVPVRAFPISDPETGIALVDPEGQERLWIEHFDELPAAMSALIKDELARREFVPQIQAIRHVSSFACPSIWTVKTDRGETTLTLKGEEDIRRLGEKKLLIADIHGIQYLIRDQSALDLTSRKILDRFL